MTLDKLRLEAQSVVDELRQSKLIAFKLTVRGVDSLGMEEYIVRFSEGPLRSLDVSWKNNNSFKDAVRSAVLTRAARTTVPLKQPNRIPRWPRGYKSDL